MSKHQNKRRKEQPKDTTDNPPTRNLNLNKIREKIKTRKGEERSRIEVRNKNRATQIYPTHCLAKLVLTLDSSVGKVNLQAERTKGVSKTSALIPTCDALQSSLCSFSDSHQTPHRTDSKTPTEHHMHVKICTQCGWI